jgi:hypothetical protein
VADAAVSLDRAKAAAFNRMEKLRDPSHVRALALPELVALFREAGLGEPQITRYELPTELDGLLARSFPNSGDGEKVRTLFHASLADDGLGVGAQLRDGRIHFAYPVAILVTTRSA